MMNCKDCEGHGWDEDTRGNMIVCKRCAGTGVALHPGDLAALAAANGYIRLEPGQVVVRVADLKVLQGWASYGNWNPEGNGDGAAFERIAAALNDSGVEL